MRIVIEPRVMTLDVDVFIIDDAHRTILQIDGQAQRWVDIGAAGAQGTKAQPTLTLPREVAEALGPALLDLAPPNTVQAEALADARGVRDRLLTLVEELARR